MAKTVAELFQESIKTVALSSPLRPGTAEQFVYYIETLLKWNKVINLTGFTSASDIIQHLILEAFPLRTFLEELHLPDDITMHDLGAGAGFPGIPLRILWDHGTYIMIEIREKRALFLAQLLANLKLSRTEVHRGSFEAYFAQKACQSDLILSKACLTQAKLFQAADTYAQENGILVCFSHTEPPVSYKNWDCIAKKAYNLPKKTHWLGAFKRTKP